MPRPQSFHEDYHRKEDIAAGSERGFGIVFFIVFAVIGLWPWLFGGAPRLWSLGVAAAFLLVALLRPGLLSPLNRIWFSFGLLLHKIVTPVVMGILFFLTVTPTGIVMRLMGKDPLHRRFDPDGDDLLDRTPASGSRPPGHAQSVLGNQAWNFSLNFGPSCEHGRSSGCCRSSS